MKNFLLTLLCLTFIFTSFSFKKKPAPVNRVAKVSRSLVFPVSGKKSHVGSFWGDQRDGGRRKHEGIDIFAKKGTPVVAICDGVIASRDNGGIGGKTISLESEDYRWSAYYAHLDKQYVREGQYVKKGQVLGTVGNTGNARYTPSHLHFGIYKSSGAINPLPYVKHSPKISVKSKTKRKTAKGTKHKIKSKRTKR
jgi:murein DD-endopeptidase MepM/ murein hydrolase activator NlpD